MSCTFAGDEDHYRIFTSDAKISPRERSEKSRLRLINLSDSGTFSQHQKPTDGSFRNTTSASMSRRLSVCPQPNALQFLFALRLPIRLHTTNRVMECQQAQPQDKQCIHKGEEACTTKRSLAVQLHRVVQGGRGRVREGAVSG